MSKKWIFVVLCFTLLLTACQKTPDEAVVISKNDLDEEITDSAENVMTAPEVWDEKILNENGDIYININAPIKIPNTDAFCVMGAQPGKFSQEEVDKLINYFSQGNSLSAANEAMTKSEIEARIVEFKRALSKAESGSEDYGTPEEIQAQIDNMTAQLATASESESDSENIVDAALTEDPETRKEVLSVKVDLGKETAATISVVNRNADDYNSSFYFQNGSLYIPVEELYGRDAAGLKTTLSDAKQQAQSILDDLGLDDYEIISAQTGIEQSNIDANNKDHQGYCFTAHLAVKNIPYLFCQGRDYTGIVMDEKTGLFVYEKTGEVVESFAPTWDVSEITIDIDDTGVTAFYWTAPADNLEIKNQKVSILSFEDMQDICKQQLKSKYLYNSDGLIYHLDSVELGLAAIAQENNIGAFWLVPAWAFYGYCENANVQNNTGEIKNNETSLLVLNALDGSVIG